MHLGLGGRQGLSFRHLRGMVLEVRGDGVRGDEGDNNNIDLDLKLKIKIFISQ